MKTEKNLIVMAMIFALVFGFSSIGSVYAMSMDDADFAPAEAEEVSAAMDESIAEAATDDAADFPDDADIADTETEDTAEDPIEDIGDVDMGDAGDCSTSNCGACLTSSKCSANASACNWDTTKSPKCQISK